MLTSLKTDNADVIPTSSVSRPNLAQSQNAYQQSQKIVEKSEDADALVLMMAADKLQKVKQMPDDQQFEDILNYNQAIWTVIQSEMTEDHPLPNEVKENFLSLSLFVDNQTAKALGSRQPELLDALIDINRNIATGLMSR